MPELEWCEVSSVEDACGWLAEGDPSVRVVGGATALATLLRRRLLPLRRLIVLRRLSDQLGRIEAEADGGLRLGALVRLRQLEADARVPAFVRQALRRLANVRVRNVATVAGTLCHGDPHQDLPGIFVALGGSVTAASRRGRREIPLDQFCRGYYETALEPDELVVGVRLKPLPVGASAAYEKVCALSMDDWPLVGVTAVVGPGVRRFVVGAADDRPIQVEGGGPEAVAAAIHPVDDLRGSAEYKRAMAVVAARRALARAEGGRSE